MSPGLVAIRRAKRRRQAEIAEQLKAQQNGGSRDRTHLVRLQTCCQF